MRYREKNPCVYILASWRYGTLVTSDLFQRVALRNQYLIEGFTKKISRTPTRLLRDASDHGCSHQTMDVASRREKQLKEWRRAWKIRLIESMNPEWIDLFEEATGEILDGPADVARRGR